MGREITALTHNCPELRKPHENWNAVAQVIRFKIGKMWTGFKSLTSRSRLIHPGITAVAAVLAVTEGFANLSGYLFLTEIIFQAEATFGCWAICKSASKLCWCVADTASQRGESGE